VRAIIDTNIWMAGLLWRGLPHRLLELVRAGVVTPIISPVLLAEFADVIGRDKFDDILLRSNTSRERSLGEVRRLCELIDAPPLPVPVCRDPDDDHVLACAIAANVDCIITGDNDLLVLKHYRHIPIVTPAEALRLIGG